MSNPLRLTTIAPQGRMVAVRRKGVTLVLRCPDSNQIFDSLLDHARRCCAKHVPGSKLEQIEDRR